MAQATATPTDAAPNQSTQPVQPVNQSVETREYKPTSVEDFQGFFDDHLKDELTPDPNGMDQVPEHQDDEPNDVPPATDDDKTPIDGESDVDPQDADTEPEDEPEDDEGAMPTLQEWLEENELDPEKFQDILVTTKVDKKTQTVPLREVIKNFQLAEHVNNKSMSLSNEKREFDAEREQFRQQAKQQLEHNEQLGHIALQQLNYDFEQIDWNRLRQDDPGEYSALMQQFQQRQATLQQMFGQLEQQKQYEAAQQKQLTEQVLQEENSKLIDAIPEWRDASVRQKATQEMANYARQIGFSDAELSQVIDHRMMRVLHDAARYQTLQAKKPQNAKRVRTAPKMVKPGTRKNRDPRVSQRQAALDRFRKNPRDKDAQIAAFEQFANS